LKERDGKLQVFILFLGWGFKEMKKDGWVASYS
jgi:hypothetical protein